MAAEPPVDGPIGMICEAGHEVFAVVAGELRVRGYPVRFFAPGEEISPSTLDDLSLLVNNVVDPASFRVLRYAERNGVSTWNGYTTLALGARLIGLTALETVGFRVPDVSIEEPSDDYVSKSLFDWHFEEDPELNGDAAIYQDRLLTAPIDYKYYAVDTGRERVVNVLRATSKLLGEKECLGPSEPDLAHDRRIRRLMDRTDARAIGVDVVESKRGWYAVDVNPAMSFRNAGMENALVESVVDCLDA